MPIRSKLKSVELDMTPMIDIVFLLMIFFTLVLNFAAADQNDRIKLPVSELAKPPDVPPTEPITLHVLADGKVIYNGSEHSLQELRKPLDWRVRFLNNMNIPLETATVIIRADAHGASGQVLDVIELCRSLQLTRFVLRAKQKEE